MAPLRLTIEKGIFRDSRGREVTLRGINLAGDAKYPSNPEQPSHVADDFFEGDNVTFRARPFPKEDAHIHFARLKRWGYNTIRYVFTWEAIEAAGPGTYDEEWIQHTIEILRMARDYGFYIFMDPHQDVSFAATEAALVHNMYPEPEKFPKMIWSTNYTRYACQTIFTLFWAGRDFAPKCIIDGKNIQDYLQEHFVGACAHLAKRISEAGDLEDDIVIGWESMNEPNRGMVGYPDISVIPDEQKLKKGTSPTVWQAILTGSGRACELDTWDFGGMGPYKSGRALVDPQGETAYLPADYDESRYGYKRDAGWKLGECIWAQHGVWDPSNDTILKKDYFKKHPKTGEVIDYEQFTNTYFMEYYRMHRDAIRAHHKNAIMFCQPPVLELPPSIKGTADDDPNMVYAPHYYDGITLMTKKWNRYWNVDVFGILRGRYLSPAFAVKIGETAIRNCLRDQLTAIRKEGLDYMGDHPCVLTEFGIPYDMDDKYAYKTGDYSSQSGAMDANHFAVEGSAMAGYTLWLYMCENNHKLGDQWNGEDLSIFSLDDRPLPLSPVPQSPTNESTLTVDQKLGSNTKREFSDESTVNPGNLKAKLKTPSISSQATTDKPPELTNSPGFRAAEAYIINYGFDLRNCVFTLNLKADKVAPQDSPTEIFLPEFHFPKDVCDVEVSGGKWTINTDDEDGGMIQRLRWWHAEGEQSIKVTGVQRRQNMSLGKEEEEGYLDQCQQSKCGLM
ncbi:putative Uncharacterized glycosyl hydrolase [Glarea lozoyensis 74030]|uniref:Putative Uncharacterized glycosyl hydrolase n=1 Tax=Glarea lozoyensis (strain ATCC 74030 / MF5533) TaxID=1104152 RepID=H0EUJ7_GLAL7|nr:putative Uncharacterized glycosyl hydrolase [Glarea lozoyensis 74030]